MGRGCLYSPKTRQRGRTPVDGLLYSVPEGIEWTRLVCSWALGGLLDRLGRNRTSVSRLRSHTIGQNLKFVGGHPNTHPKVACLGLFLLIMFSWCFSQQQQALWLFSWDVQLENNKSMCSLNPTFIGNAVSVDGV